MKRIDDKIKEIEKKDKTNRIIFIAVVAIVAAWYIFVTQRTMKEQSEQIGENELTIAEQNTNLKKTNDSLELVVERLSKSQTPIGFWTQTLEAKNAASYLNYLMHNGKPEAKEEYREKAIENLQLPDTDGKTVWLYGGNKTGDNITSKKVFEVIYRHGKDFESNNVPAKFDVVENVTMNRNTYRNYSSGNTTGPNNADKAWKKDSKAFILDVQNAGDAVFIKIKF